MLAPIRDYVAAAYPPDPGDLDRAVSHYARLAATGVEIGSHRGAQVAARLQAETGNITAMLERAAAERRTNELTEAIQGLTEY